MVRLKEIFSQGPQTAAMFQFQYGTIKSTLMMIEIFLTLFQFQYGTIKRQLTDK